MNVSSLTVLAEEDEDDVLEGVEVPVVPDVGFEDVIAGVM
jgi:hypothetical protein